ncbi:MAG: LptF/LptG family permease [Candidatus Marinimicrobia bacterium]|nr:LptF/LptG family permease [Candidatus Neomarinimicrobiota bacterium]
MFGFKLIDRYVLKKFIVIFLLSLITFILIFNIVDIIEKIDKFIRAKMSLAAVGTYCLYQLPLFINIAIPMSLLLASVFTIGTLSKNNELAAIKSSGISLYRLSAPLLFVGLLFSVGSFFFEDTLVIPASRKRIEIEQNKLKRRRYSKKKIFNNVMYQDSPTCNIVISKFSTKNNTATSVTIQYTSNHVLTKRIDARKMIWIPEKNSWKVSNFKIRNFDNEGNETVSSVFSDSLLQFNLKPDDIIQTSLKPDAMRYRELSNFIKRLKESGNDPRKWAINLYFKIAFPFTNFIVILFGLPLAAMKHKKGISFGAGMSLLVIFTYYGFIKFGQVLGYKEILNPLLSVWLGNIIFLIAGARLLYKIRQ